MKSKKKRKRKIKALFNDFAWTIACDMHRCYDVVQTDLQCKWHEDLIWVQFIRVEWLNIRKFDKLKINLIDSDQIEYDRNEVREIWLLTVSQILQNCLRFQTDFEVSEENDMQWCFNFAREEFTTEDVV